MLATATIRHRPSLPLVFGSAGLGLILLAAALPWLSLYRGLEPVPGLLLDGGPLAGIGVAIAGLLIATALPTAARPPAPGLVRPFAVVGAILIAADALWSFVRVATFASAPGPAGALLQPSVGPGAPLMAAGAAILAGAALVTRPTSPFTDRRSVARFCLVAALFVAGWAHLLLVPAHLSEAPVLGVAFALAAVAQLGLAAVLLASRADLPLLGAIAVNASAIAIYVLAVTVGLPGHDHLGAAAALVPESVDPVGLATKAMEAVGVVLAVGLFGRNGIAA